MISMSSWLIEPLLNMKSLSLSVKILPDLKVILPNINKVSPVFLCFLYSWYIPFHWFIFSRFLYIQNTSHMAKYYTSFFLSNNLFLLIRVFKPLIFNIVIDMIWVDLLFAICFLFCWYVSVPMFLFFCLL